MHEDMCKLKIRILEHARQPRLVGSEIVVELHKIKCHIGGIFIMTDKWDYIRYEVLELMPPFTESVELPTHENEGRK